MKLGPSFVTVPDCGVAEKLVISVQPLERAEPLEPVVSEPVLCSTKVPFGPFKAKVFNPSPLMLVNEPVTPLLPVLELEDCELELELELEDEDVWKALLGMKAPRLEELDIPWLPPRFPLMMRVDKLC
jgi:hypothetical protein